MHPGSGSGGGNGEFNYTQNLTNKEMLEQGKQAYDTNCASCHGLQGQGGVGPNLVDDFGLLIIHIRLLKRLSMLGLLKRYAWLEKPF